MPRIDQRVEKEKHVLQCVYSTHNSLNRKYEWHREMCGDGARREGREETGGKHERKRQENPCALCALQWTLYYKGKIEKEWEREREREFTRLFMADKSLKLSFELETFGRIYFQCGSFFLGTFRFAMRNENSYELKKSLLKHSTSWEMRERVFVCGRASKNKTDDELKVFWLMQTENVAFSRTNTYTHARLLAREHIALIAYSL